MKAVTRDTFFAAHGTAAIHDAVARRVGIARGFAGRDRYWFRGAAGALALEARRKQGVGLC